MAIILVALAACEQSAPPYNAELRDLRFDRAFTLRYSDPLDEHTVRTFEARVPEGTIQSTGTASRESWQDTALPGSVYSSMNGFQGSATSGAGDLVATRGPFNARFAIRRGATTLVLFQATGLVPSLGISQARWFPDGQHIAVVANDKVGILEPATGKYAYVALGTLVSDVK